MLLKNVSLHIYIYIYIYIRSSEKFLSFYKEIMDTHFPFYIILSNYVWSILFYQNKDHNVRQIWFHVCIKMRRCKRRVCKRKTLFRQPNIYIFINVDYWQIQNVAIAYYYVLIILLYTILIRILYICNNVNPSSKSDDRLCKIGFILGTIILNTITVNKKSTTNFCWENRESIFQVPNYRSSLVIYSIQQMTAGKTKQN